MTQQSAARSRNELELEQSVGRLNNAIRSITDLEGLGLELDHAGEVKRLTELRLAAQERINALMRSLTITEAEGNES